MTTTDANRPRRRLTAVPPDAVPEAPRRSARRQVGTPEQAITADLSALAKKIYDAKTLADQATADYEALRKQGLVALAAAKKNEHIIPAEGDRPAFQMKIMERATNTIDPAKFRKMVEDSEFMQCVSIRIGDAKNFVGEARLEKITTTAKSAPFLDCRVKGKTRD